jgi:hypothetical protein
VRLSFTAGAAAFVALALAASACAAQCSPSLGLAPAKPWPPDGGAILGVTCGNLTACDRVGIAVWLTHPASEVDATLAGIHVRLRPPRGRTQDYWSSFVHLPLHSLGLPTWWDGAHPTKTMTLALRVHYRSGWRHGEVRVQLLPGWG